MANNPLLSKFEHTAQDRAGNPIVGATITIRKQGATVVSGGPNSFTVDDVGGIVAGENVNVYNADGTDPGSATRSVSSITSTNVTVGGPGFTASNNDRISPQIGPPIFADANADEALGLTIMTNADGYASCWTYANTYDVVRVGGTSPLGTAQTHVWFDIVVGNGSGLRQINTFVSATSITDQAFLQRVGVAGHKFIVYTVPGPQTDVWYVGLKTATSAIVPGHNVAGALTIDSGGLTVTAGASTVQALTTQALTSTTGAFSGLLSPQAGVTVTGGDVTVAGNFVNAKRLASTSGTAVVAGDFALGAGWGTTATVSFISPGSTDTRGQIRITSSGTGQAAQPSIIFTFKDGTYSTSPFMVATSGTNFTDLTDKNYWYVAAAPTTATFIFGGTPVAARVYELNWVTIK